MRSGYRNRLFEDAHATIRDEGAVRSRLAMYDAVIVGSCPLHSHKGKQLPHRDEQEARTW